MFTYNQKIMFLGRSPISSLRSLHCNGIFNLFGPVTTEVQKIEVFGGLVDLL